LDVVVGDHVLRSAARRSYSLKRMPNSRERELPAILGYAVCMPESWFLRAETNAERVMGSSGSMTGIAFDQEDPL
jgi:hypothetical protein